MKATILNIGNELLNGRTVNTNATQMALDFNQIGVEITEVRVLADDADSLIQSLNHLSASTDLVVITGGLGPTPDDMTREIVAQWSDSELVLFPEAEAHLQTIFGDRFTSMREVNIIQAYFPQAAKLLPNPHGTAMGFYLNHSIPDMDNQNLLICCVPGVPYECLKMVKNQIIDKLLADQPLVLIQREFYSFGLGESRQTEVFKDYEIPYGVIFASLPSRSGLLVRLSMWSENTPAARDKSVQLVDLVNTNLQALISDVYPEVIVGKAPLLQYIESYLIEHHLKISTAESCTSGLLGFVLTQTAGSSQWYEGGIQSYSNEVKMNQLGVKPYVLEEYGAVSEETVAEMALGVAQLLKTDIAVSISGIAGPSGGTDHKPVGTICFGLYIKGKLYTETKRLIGQREEVRERSAWYALDFLRRMLIR